MTSAITKLLGISAALVALLESNRAFTAPQEAITLGQIGKLSANQAGEFVLKGQPHGAIEFIEPARRQHHDHPSWTRLDFYEIPKKIRNGCSRKVWRATFYRRMSMSESEAALDRKSIFSSTEAAIRSGTSCKNAEFAHLNPNISVEQALSALSFLQSVKSGARKVKFQCKNETTDPLCGADTLIISQLKNQQTVVIARVEQKVDIWMNRRPYKRSGQLQMITGFTFDPAQPDTVQIYREMPSPY